MFYSQTHRLNDCWCRSEYKVLTKSRPLLKIKQVTRNRNYAIIVYKENTPPPPKQQPIIPLLGIHFWAKKYFEAWKRSNIKLRQEFWRVLGVRISIWFKFIIPNSMNSRSLLSFTLSVGSQITM